MRHNSTQVHVEGDEHRESFAFVVSIVRCANLRGSPLLKDKKVNI